MPLSNSLGEVLPLSAETNCAGLNTDFNAPKRHTRSYLYSMQQTAPIAETLHRAFSGPEPECADCAGLSQMSRKVTYPHVS
jgi:hypothetical protein